MLSKRPTRTRTNANPAPQQPITTATKNDIEKELKSFDEYYDDSSDEESVANDIAQYDINKCWKQAQDNLKLNSKNSLINDDLLSFVAHAAGNKFLHSAHINKLYYPLKHKILSEQNEKNKATAQLQDRINKAITQSIDETFASIKQFLKLTGQKKFSDADIQKVMSVARDEFIVEIRRLKLDHLAVMIDWLKVDKLCYREKVREKERVINSVSALEDELIAILQSIFIKKITLDKSNDDRKTIKTAVIALVDQNLDYICKQYRFEKLMHTKGRDEAMQEMSTYDGAYSHFVKKIRAMIESAPANGKVQTMLFHKLEEHGQRKELTRSYIEDLIVINSVRGKMSAAESDMFKKYFTFNSASLSDELADSFAVYLHNNINNALKSFHRPTLGGNYLFASTNPLSFYANLRLSNRSQKRQILNKRYALFKSDNVARTWKLNNETKAVVVENQELSNGTLGRRDYVQGLGKYDKIYADILQIKNDLQTHHIDVDDKKITEWIRQAFSGIALRLNYSTISDAVKQSIEDMIDRVSYLLHGCEASRNIAMIVIIPMMLDLILEGDEWTLEEAFTGSVDGEPVERAIKLMPMSPEGAVAAARTLERVYRPFTPHHYVYPGVEDRDGTDKKMSKDELVQFEARVVRAWINLKIGANIKLPSSQLAEWLLHNIEDQYGRWFGIKLENTTDNIKGRNHVSKPK